MLDECKGERFGELLARFAMLVLRKVTEMRKDLPLVTRALLDSSQGQHHSEVLSIAYKTSLHMHLESRRHFVAQLSHQQRSLDNRDAELTERKHRLLEALSKHSQEDHSPSLDVLKSSWSGDSRWLTVLLSDVPVSSNSSSMLDPSTSSDEGASDSCLPSGSSALMNNLDKRIQQHDSRLKELRIYQSSRMHVEQPQKPPDKNLATSTHGSWSMDKHQHLRISPTRIEANRVAHNKRVDLLPGHADLLERMERELKTSGGFLPPVENASMEPLYAQTASQPQDNANPDIEKPANSTTFKPVLRTPKKEHDHLFTSSASSTPNTLPPTNQHADTSECSWLAESTKGIRASPFLPSMTHKTGTNPSSQKDQYGDARSVVDKSQLSPEDQTPMSMTNMHITSLDRAASPDLNKSLPESKHIWLSSPPNSTAQLSLADRTRQSMSLLDRLSDAKAQSKQARTSRLSKVQPVRQFETPRKQSRQQTALTPASNNTTPREDLFTDQADEASIFKSRVKIAVSPLISPERGVLDEIFMDVSRLENEGDVPG